MKRLLFCLCCVFMLHCWCHRSLAADAKRPLTPDDLFRLEELDDPNWSSFPPVSISPDGQNVAFVLKRARNTAKTFGLVFLNDFDRADIWIASPGKGRTKNITNGATDNSGFWAPVWSPDGQRLAMLSTRGSAIRVWVWTKSSDSIEIASKRSTEFLEPTDLEWISDHELLFPILATGQTSVHFDADHRIAGATHQAWLRAWEGETATASVLESGTQSALDQYPQGHLLVVDLATRSEKEIATAPSFGTLRMSPDRRFLAFLKQVAVWHPERNEAPLSHIRQEIYEVQISDLNMRFRTSTLAGVREAFLDSLSWSRDGTELSVVGYPTDLADAPAEVFRCKITESICRPATNELLGLNLHANVSSPPVVWHGRHDLLVLASEIAGTEAGLREMKWWTVDERGNRREFFPSMTDPPSDLRPEPDGDGLIGIIRGSIWRIDADGHAVQNLTPNFEGKITSIEWPESPDRPPKSELIFALRSSTTTLYHLDLTSLRVSSVAMPSPEATLAAFDAKNGVAAFIANSRTGTYIWLHRVNEEGFSSVVETNTFLQEVFEGELRKLEYRGLDGQDLNAWMILPFGYESGKRYPVITWVYAGQVYGEEPPRFLVRINESNPLNLQLLAAHGYVVLLPSMPLKAYGEVDDPYMELTKGVLPAIDKLIDLGIADRGRIGVMGHSYGGYSTYGLITQTNRFRAGVALAGISDLVSQYGTFETRERYDPFAQEDPFRLWNVETAYLGNPPWKALSRYFVNSPINYVERVQTPLLIIQGDLDYIPIQQGEEFFTALYRQNKRARFVRYWGEDHMLTSPANIQDMWQQIYVWFDEFLGSKPPSSERPSD